MSPHERMERYARRVPGGGIAWERSVFARYGEPDAGRLIDAAVDIAWECLLPYAMGEQRLAINEQGRLLVFRLERIAKHEPLPLAA